MSEPAKNKITGILLAGGHSKRMGRDKGNIKIGGHLMYHYPLKVLEYLCGKVLISTCNKTDYSGKYTIVCDEIPGIGPIGGICSCLKKSDTELNIVLSCDMPMVNKNLLEYLLLVSNGYDVVVPSLFRNKAEPLCGVYRKTVIDMLDQLIRNKVYAVHAVFDLVRCNKAEINETMPFYSPDMFMNVNSAGDLDHLKTLLDKSR
jgi:molybdopterin-guanine dinucleotide biosynthesis protein A